MLCVLAQLQAMQYEFDPARELYTRARAMFEELGLHVDASTLSLSSAHVELLAGNPEAADVSYGAATTISPRSASATCSPRSPGCSPRR